MKQKLIDFYHEFIGCYIDIEKFAAMHELKPSDCIDLLSLGQKYQNEALEKANIIIC